MKKKIFISHSYSSSPNLNKMKVEKICCELVKQGIVPISPLHLFSFYEEDTDRGEIMETCKHLIKFVDEVWIYGLSPGCIEELKYALQIGKHIEIMIPGFNRKDLLDVIGGKYAKLAE